MKRSVLALCALLALGNFAEAANTTLGNLAAGAAVSGTDLFYGVQTVGSGGVKLTATQLKAFMSASPTFTGTVAGAGTIPLTVLATQATNTITGNATAGAASPTALAIGSCSATGSALLWTTNTGFGCATGYAPLASPAFTGTPTAPTLTLGTASSATGTLVLANAGSALTTTIQAGVNVTASRTYTWPTNFGAAGSVLTDAAGNGTLSWAAGGGGGGTPCTTTALSVQYNAAGSFGCVINTTANGTDFTALGLSNTAAVTFNGRGILTSSAAGTINHGAADVNGAPVAQIIKMQSALAGSATDTASANTTIIGSLGTGTGTNGDIIFQTGVKTTTGTAQATATQALTIKGENGGYQVTNGGALEYGGCAWVTNVWTCGPTTNGGTARNSAYVSGNGVAVITISNTGSFATLGASTSLLVSGGAQGISLATANGKLSIAGSGIGTNYMGLGQTTNDAMCLGWSASFPNGAITCALTWTDNGTVTIAPNNSILTVAGSISATLAAATGTNAVCNTPGTSTALTVQVWATGCAASSARFKEGIASLSRKDALADVLKFEAVSYRYRPEFNMGNDRHVGFTAEQVGSIDSQWITYEDDGVTPHAVKYNEMIPLLAAAIQELKAEIEAIKSK